MAQYKSDNFIYLPIYIQEVKEHIALIKKDKDKPL